MSPANRFAARHPTWFALAATATWLVLLVLFLGPASGALRRPYGDDLSTSVGRVLTSLLFAVLHSTQVLTNDLSRSAAVLLTAQRAARAPAGAASEPVSVAVAGHP